MNETLEKISVGKGATSIVGSDRYPYTVVKVSNSGKTAWVQADHFERTDNNGQSEDQHYRFERKATSKIERISLRKDGRWRFSNYYQTPIVIGERRAYLDPGF